MPRLYDHLARIADRTQFDEDSIYRETKDLPPGMFRMMGKREGSKTAEPVSYSFANDKFSSEEAEAWLADRKIPALSFEAASDPKAKEGNKYEEAEDGSFTIFDVEVLAPGTWPARDGEVTLTDDDVARIGLDTAEVEELVKGPVKLGHDDKSMDALPPGGKPAWGWLQKFRLKGGKVICNIVRMPKTLFSLVKKGQYRRVSAEVLLNWENPETKKKSRVIGGLAILGATLPAITTLKDLLQREGEQVTICFELEGPIEPGTPDDGKPVNSNPDAGSKPRETTKNLKPNGSAAPAPEKEPSMPTPEEERDVALLEAKEAKEALATVQKVADEAKEQLIDAKFAQAASERRVSGADIEREKPIVLKMSMPDAKIFLDGVMERAQAPDKTKKVADGTPPDPPPADKKELHGDDYFIARTAELLEAKTAKEDGTLKTHSECMEQAATEKPDKDRAWHLAYKLTAESMQVGAGKEA